MNVWRSRLVMVCLAMGSRVVGVGAQEGAPAQPPEIEEPAESEASRRDLTRYAGDAVVSMITEMKSSKVGALIGGPVDSAKAGWDRMNDWLDEAIGLRLGLAYTGLIQGATPGTGPPDDPDAPRFAGAGDVDFFGAFRLSEPDATNKGTIVFQFEQRHAYTQITPRELGSSIGSLWGTTSGFSERDLFLKQLYWEQTLLDDRLQVRMGKIDQSDAIGSHRLESDNQYFLNAAFSGNPVAAIPDNGFGLNVAGFFTDTMYVAGGIGDANGRFGAENFEKFLEDSEFYRALELGWRPAIDGLGVGHYRATIWATDARAEAGLPSDSGLALTFDQELGKSLVTFGRYTISSGNLTRTREMAVGGIGIADPFGMKDDYAGVAVAWGEPSDTDKREQWVAEAFYRLQFTSTIQLTADAQIIIDPTNAPDDDVVGVFGLRFRVVF